MATVIEETGLTTRSEQSYELAPTAGAAEKQFEIQSAIVIAKRFPRNEDAAFQKLMKAASRPSFADDAAYSFPRGGATVSGPSINLAREAARVWGNIRYGLEIIRDDDESRQIRGWAWDVESNTKVTAEDEFKKLVQRKQKAGGTLWVKPDERDLRELTNRRGSILMRNCLLQLLPKDLVEDALTRCAVTLQHGAKEDPDGARKKIILAFSELNVTPEMLEQKIGHPLAQCSPAEIAELRTIYKSIADGNSTWAEYVEPKRTEPEKGSLNVTDIKAGTSENRGHGNEGLEQVGKPKAAGKSNSTPTPEPPKSTGGPFGEEEMGSDLFGREPGIEG